MTQGTLDQVSRFQSIPRCSRLKRDGYSGMILPDGTVIMGTCSMKGGTVYDRDCIGCTMCPDRRDAL